MQVSHTSTHGSTRHYIGLSLSLSAGLLRRRGRWEDGAVVQHLVARDDMDKICELSRLHGNVYARELV